MPFVNGKYVRGNPHDFGEAGGIEILNDNGMDFPPEMYANRKKPKKNLSDFK